MRDFYAQPGSKWQDEFTSYLAPLDPRAVIFKAHEGNAKAGKIELYKDFTKICNNWIMVEIF